MSHKGKLTINLNGPFCMYMIGLILMIICLGIKYGLVISFLTLGIGLVLWSLITSIFTIVIGKKLIDKVPINLVSVNSRQSPDL